MGQIQLIQISPEDLQEQIGQTVQEKLDVFFQRFKLPNPDEEFLTREQVCALIKITKPTLWSYTREGKLQSHSVGSRVLYRKSEVLAAVTKINQK